MSRTDEVYKPALAGKKIPILTLDNKWHQLFTRADINSKIAGLEIALNDLQKRQGKLNSELKEIKKLKKKLMDDIVTSAYVLDKAEQKTDPKKEKKKLNESKRLLNECNEKLEAYQDELHELPREINRANNELMLATMETCYEKIQENSDEITEISEWISSIRIELKKNIIRKQEREQKNKDLYSYMHDIFGADVIEIFDMKYIPDNNKPTEVIHIDEEEHKESDAPGK